MYRPNLGRADRQQVGVGRYIQAYRTYYLSRVCYQCVLYSFDGLVPVPPACVCEQRTGLVGVVVVVVMMVPASGGGHGCGMYLHMYRNGGGLLTV